MGTEQRRLEEDTLHSDTRTQASGGLDASFKPPAATNLYGQTLSGNSDLICNSSAEDAVESFSKGESLHGKNSAKHFSAPGRDVFWGDAVEILHRVIPNESVDLVFADPPYNIGKKFGEFEDRWPDDDSYASWCYEWLELCIAKLRPNGSLYLMASTQAMPLLDLYLRKKLSVISRIVWHYDSSGVQARRKFGSIYEPILHCVKDPKCFTFNAAEIEVEAKTGAKRKLIDYRKLVPAPYSSTKIPGNVWYFPRVRYRMDEYENHPTQKPEKLLERVILASSNPGDMVLDPFSGSFTTACVAHRLNRKVIAIDQEIEYVKIGLRRLGMEDAWQGEPLLPPQKQFRKRQS